MTLIAGQVFDGATMQPLPGASVVQKGSTNGTSADSNGGFQLTVSGEPIITISYVGYDDYSAPASFMNGYQYLAKTGDSLGTIVVTAKRTLRKSVLLQVAIIVLILKLFKLV